MEKGRVPNREEIRDETENLVEWLLDVEQMAANLYLRASEHFEQNKEFSAFLLELSEDEIHHKIVLERAAKVMTKRQSKIPSDIVLDSATRRGLEGPLLSAHEALLSDRISEEEMVECIAKTEFSEGNDLFLYVIDTVKDGDREFQQAAAMIQSHRKKLERFLESLEDGAKHLETVRALSPVWDEAVLVVEDSEPIANLMKAIFEKEADVETVENGEKALKRLGERHFDVIVSDLDMPGMSGIEFYKKVLERAPDAGKRFLFYSGNLTTQSVGFFKRNNLPFLEKPAPVSVIRQAVLKILDRSS